MTGFAASVIRQSLIPMAAFYLIFMTALGIGLVRLRRHSATAAGPAQDRAGQRTAPGPAGGGDGRDGSGGGPGASLRWPALIRHALSTAVGGYLLLLGVVIAYYYGIARVGGDFLASAVTGPALLIVLAAPVFAARSWLAERTHRHSEAGPGEASRDSG